MGILLLLLLLLFSPLTSEQMGSESRDTADISWLVHLRAQLQAEPTDSRASVFIWPSK